MHGQKYWPCTAKKKPTGPPQAFRALDKGPLLIRGRPALDTPGWWEPSPRNPFEGGNCKWRAAQTAYDGGLTTPPFPKRPPMNTEESTTPSDPLALYGRALAMDAVIAALLQVLPREALQPLAEALSAEVEGRQNALQASTVPEIALSEFEHHAQRASAMIQKRFPLL